MDQLSRRSLMAQAIAAAGTMIAAPATAAPGTGSVVPLPDAARIRADYKTMVDFGARLPGTENHLRFVAWMAGQFRSAGLAMGPCESYAYRRWEPKRWALSAGGTEIPRVAYYVRSQPTAAAGVNGPLVYGGPIDAQGRSGLGDFPKGAILVFDGQLPKMTVRQLLNPEFVHLRSQTQDEVVDEPYHRLWTTPAYDLDDYHARGAAGVAIVMDVSSAMIAGNFSPHASAYRPPLPALFVGSDVAEPLRTAARAGAHGHLTLDAAWIQGDVPAITAILPGTSDEVMIVDTHTDGQNCIEENGCLTLIQLARHFASLPSARRLKRSLVFVGWPGHMAGTLPQAEGWIRAHRDVMHHAAAAFTIEHLGAPEWIDRPGRGYGPTGRNEYVNLPVTAGPMRDLLQAGVVRHDLLMHGIQKGPGITTGSAFHESGVPHAACICGPSYLLNIRPGGELDKLDADLAVRQTAMLAELIAGVDAVPAATLRATDASLGRRPVTGPDTSIRSACL